MDAELLELMPDTVLIAPKTGQNKHGEPSYGADVEYSPTSEHGRALVEWGTAITRFQRLGDPVGKVITSTAVVYLSTVDPAITTESRITLSDGRKPPIMEVKRFSDPAGPYYTEIHL